MKKKFLAGLLSTFILCGITTNAYSDEGLPCTPYLENSGPFMSEKSLQNSIDGFVNKGYQRNTNDSSCSLNNFTKTISLEILLKRIESTFFDNYNGGHPLDVGTYKKSFNSLGWFDIAVDKDGVIDLNFQGKEGYFKIDDYFVLYTILRKEYNYSRAVPTRTWAQSASPDEKSIKKIISVIKETYIQNLFKIMYLDDLNYKKMLMMDDVDTRNSKTLNQVVSDSKKEFESAYQKLSEEPEGDKLVKITVDLIKGMNKIIDKYMVVRNKKVKEQLDYFAKEKEIGKKKVVNLLNAVHKKTKIPLNILKIYVQPLNPQPLAFFVKDFKGKITYEKLQENGFIISHSLVDPLTKKVQSIKFLFLMEKNPPVYPVPFANLSRVIANNQELNSTEIFNFYTALTMQHNYEKFAGEYQMIQF